TAAMAAAKTAVTITGPIQILRARSTCVARTPRPGFSGDEMLCLGLLAHDGHGSTSSLTPDRVSRPRISHVIWPAVPAPLELEERISKRCSPSASSWLITP